MSLELRVKEKTLPGHPTVDPGPSCTLGPDDTLSCSDRYAYFLDP